LSRNTARKAHNSPVYITPTVVNVAPEHLGYDISVFIDGKAHIEFRKCLSNLFTRKSLGLYLPGQEAVYREYFSRFINITKENGGKPVPFISEFRQVMCAVSLRTFVGHYISDAAVKNIADNSSLIPAALDLVTFPLIIPYTRAWYSKKAADMVLSEFCTCAAKSKVRMAAGGEVACIMDAWIQSMVESQRWREVEEADDLTEDMKKPQSMARMFNDFEIAQVVFTFLFSLQEATSSAVARLFQVVAQRPDVLEKVRDENLQVRDGVVHAELSMEQLESLTYTRAVVREVFRYRRPVLMVPYQRKKLFPIPNSDAVFKGSISPTTYTALYNPEVYEKPEHFDPERYQSADAREEGAKNHLLFGAGPHSCIGQLYTPLNLALCLGKASVQMDWQYNATPKSEKVKWLASTFPMDDCSFTFQKRGNW
jgi:C-22 sterol desaturase